MGIKVFNADFYPRSPCGERRAGLNIRRIQKIISIHALLAESDEGHKKPKCRLGHFYPRSPCGERHGADLLSCFGRSTFLSTLSLRRATRAHPSSQAKPQFLSTLSLRRATFRNSCRSFLISISIHALLAESDRGHRRNDRSPIHFYPRSPCGERPSTQCRL